MFSINNRACHRSQKNRNSPYEYNCICKFNFPKKMENLSGFFLIWRFRVLRNFRLVDLRKPGIGNLMCRKIFGQFALFSSKEVLTTHNFKRRE